MKFTFIIIPVDVGIFRGIGFSGRIFNQDIAASFSYYVLVELELNLILRAGTFAVTVTV